jgi:putative salt-induced outer membrane protein YdiY
MKMFRTTENDLSFTTLAAAALLGLAMAAGLSRADEVVLSNGDKLNGKVGLVSGGVMKFTSPALGDLSIPLAKVKTYSTDTPATLRMKDGHFVHGTIRQADGKQIVTTDGETIPTADVERINPPPAGWTGSVVANGALNRGNTNNESIGISSDATLRRDTPQNDDKFSLNGSYNFVRTGRGSSGSDTADNAGASATYDDFFSEKFYGYANAGYFHDRIAKLNYRLTPGIGAGYQWFEQKDFNLSTEGGISYLYQDFQNAPVTQDAALRLAYHVDKTFNDHFSLFNDVEYIVPLKLSETDRYVLTADVGLHANLTKSFFSEFKIVYHRNDHPPTGSLKDDLAYLLGVGWKF